MRSRVALLIVLAVAAALRFARLDAKPLWLDEAMTILISAGRAPADVPVARVAPLSTVRELFSVDAAASPRSVIERLRDPLVQHTHPPLFYLLLRSWMQAAAPSVRTLAWHARALPALFGVAAVAIVFVVTAAAASGRAATIAAAMTAASPLMVMLSQEARNYTLPLVCAALSTWALVEIVDALEAARRPTLRLWILWIVANIAGCYAHYYVVVLTAAQALTLAWLMRSRGSRGDYAALALSTVAVAAAFAPWLPTMAVHSRSPEQGWMHESNPLVYIYDTLSAWQVMIQGWKLDIDSPQRWWKAVRIAIGIAILGYIALRVAATLRASPVRPATRALGAVVAVTIGALLVASALQQKDLVGEYRYHFVYYPALIALVAIALASSPPRIVAALVALELVHSVLVVTGWEYAKPLAPQEVASVLARVADAPVVIAIGEASYHETVIALAYLLAVDRSANDAVDREFVFVRRGDAYPTFHPRDLDPQIFWQRFSHVELARAPRSAFVWSAYSLPIDYPDRFEVGAHGAARVSCTIDPRERDRAFADDESARGPFRLYHCL